jgi:hypothetical protein
MNRLKLMPVKPAAQIEQALKLVKEFKPVTTSTHNESTYHPVSPEGR